jgi:integrase
MARSVRSADLETRTARLKKFKVARKKPEYIRIGPGLSLGYRRNKTDGTWVLRVADGKGGATTRAIGSADDFSDANGATVLDFWEAQEKAKSVARGSDGSEIAKPLTVNRAAEVYLAVLEAKNPRTARDTRGRLNLHFLPKFGDELVTALTKSKLEVWLNSLVVKSADREAVRKSKDTANRVLSMVKALLNHALRDPGNRIADDHAWRLVKPHKGVAMPRAAHFTAEQARALIGATPDKDFADLLTAAFLTGARYGELIACSVRDFDPVSKTLSVNGKTGPRTVILQVEAVEFFKGLDANRVAGAPLLQRQDGGRWSRSHQQRRMALALERSGLGNDATFYALRHSYISRAIEGEVPLNVIADNCGTSIRMIETTYAKVLAGKRREFIERGAPRLERPNLEGE